MITVIQRVRRGAVTIDDETTGAIDKGLVLLVGVERGDTDAEADATVRKVAAMRCFPGRTPMDATVGEAGGACLVVSQFTLAAELAAGNRPSFTAAEEPENARRLYERVASGLAATGLTVATGRFGAHMAVLIDGDGPVTFVLTVRGGKVVPRGA